MKFPITLGGALLLSATLLFPQSPAAADPKERNGKLLWFQLSEGREKVIALLGPPAKVADFGADFQSWHYQIGNEDHHDFSHELVFRKPGGMLISVTRNYEQEENVDSLFPPAQTRTYNYTEGGRPQYSVRVRRLSPGTLLMAMGTSAPGQKTGQIVLIRESELRYFHPWLFDLLSERKRD